MAAITTGVTALRRAEEERAAKVAAQIAQTADAATSVGELTDQLDLPNDVARCAGRFRFGPDDPVCNRRDQCARYVALIAGDGADENGAWNRASVFSGLCRDDEDHFIPAGREGAA